MKNVREKKLGIYKIKKDPETLKKLEELGDKISKEIWERQQRRKLEQIKAYKRVKELLII